MALRLLDRQTNMRVIVLDDRVYADIDGDRKIGKGDEVGAHALGARHAALVEAARYINQFSDTRVPGVVNADGSVVSGGTLNAAER